MSEDFAPLNETLDDLTAGIAGGERKKLAGAIASDLRNANARRIKANLTPEGADMVPRKAKKSGGVRPRRLRDTITRLKRSVKTQRMFQRAIAGSYLRKESSAGEAQVGFVGAMARIMSVHHYGLRDTVTRDPSSPATTYPARPVIGMTADDRLQVLERVTDHLAA
jgi:phage virion morphogenesis protein